MDDDDNDDDDAPKKSRTHTHKSVKQSEELKVPGLLSQRMNATSAQRTVTGLKEAGQ